MRPVHQPRRPQMSDQLELLTPSTMSTDTTTREPIVAALARLLLEAANPDRESEVRDDAP